MTFRLLRPDEVLTHWEVLRDLLDKAVHEGRGEVDVDDLRDLVLGGRMFIFAALEDGSPVFALTAEFMLYPRKNVLLVGFGAGVVNSLLPEVWSALSAFAARGGATTIQTYVKNPAMVRYHRRFFDAAPAYTVLEKQL